MSSLEGAGSAVSAVAPLTRLFETITDATPDDDVLTDASHAEDDRATLTARQLNHKANKLARWLVRRTAGLQCRNPDGDRIVALCGDKSLDFVVTIVAILKAGMGYLPLDPSYPQSRVSHIQQDCQPLLLLARGRPAIITDEADAIDLDAIEAEVDACSDANIPDDELTAVPDSESVACILYTSGSTGVPKGVRIPVRAIMNHLTWQWRSFPLAEGEVVCCPAPVVFVDSLYDILGGLLSGHRLVLLGKEVTRDAGRLVRVLEEERVGRILLVPTLLRALLLVCRGEGNTKLAALRTWLCSSEVLSPDLLLRFFDIFDDGSKVVCNCYTSTEVAGMTNIEIRSKEEATKAIIDNKVAIGLPVLNTSLRIVSSTGDLCVNGAVGEACFSGANVARGYVGGIGDDKFVTNKFSTKKGHEVLYCVGDFVRDAGGSVLYEGRRDEQVKVRGHRVDMSEIEVALQSLDGVAQCTVLCHLPGEPAQTLVGFYTTSNTNIDDNILLSQLRGLVMYYMVPQLMSVASIPLLSSGKTDRKKLLALYADRNKGATIDMGACPSGLELLASELLGVVMEVLGPAARKTVALTDSFFNIGGNSLNVALVIGTLQDKGWTIGIVEFLRANTLLDFLKLTTQKQTEAKSEKFTIHDITEADKEELLELATMSAPRENLMKSLNVPLEEIRRFFKSIWQVTLEQGLSFFLRRVDTGEMACFEINYDFVLEPEEIELGPHMAYLMEILGEVEGEAKKKLNCKPGEILISFYVGTAVHLTTSENAEALLVSEMENQRRAKLRNFKSVVHTNTSRATRTLCEGVLGYTVISSIKPEDFVTSDGKKPFTNLSYRTAVSALTL